VTVRQSAVLQCKIDRLIEIGRCRGMEMNVEQTKVMNSSKLSSQVQIFIDKETGECGIFQLNV
jgi:hypothetical protein